MALSPRVPGFLLQAAARETGRGGDTVLVVLQLSGGNDGLNTIVPYADDIYQKNRFSLRIDENRVLKIDDHVGFHPRLRGFANLLEEGQLAIVQGAGYPNPNRSHFESMDIWHTAQRETKAPASGWLGRALALDQRTGLPAMHLGGDVQPLALVSRDVPVPSLRSLQNFRLNTGGDARLRMAIEEAAAAERSGNHQLLSFLHDSTSTALEASRRVEKAARGSASPVKYPGSELAKKLQSIAKLIGAGLDTRVYYVTRGGFDTHSNQSQTHAELLNDVSTSVQAFLKDVAQHGDGGRVLVLAFSEFGRRVKENASRGTDHGAAAPIFLAGQRVTPGLIGEHPRLDDLADGDVKFHTDFRRVYAAALNWLGWDPAPVLGKQFESLNVIRQA